MKEFLCSSCRESWSVKDEQVNKVLCCPFCAFEIPKPKEIIVTSFETAIQKAINDLSVEVLKNRNQFIAYLMDIALNFKKKYTFYQKFVITLSLISCIHYPIQLLKKLNWRVQS